MRLAKEIAAFFVSFVVILVPPTIHMVGDVPETAVWKQSYKEMRAEDDNLTLQIPAEWKGTGAGKETFLHLDYKAVYGYDYPTRNQGNSPSCVGQAVATAVDILAATEIHRFGENERAPPANVSAEVVYGMSRQEIGELGQYKAGGSFNLWACQAINQYGTVPQRNYQLLGIDLTEFSEVKAVLYGRFGCPDSLEPLASNHKIREYMIIKSWADVRDAIYNGCPVVVGSPQGFGNTSYVLKRDRDGFLNPPRRLFFPSVWRHSMVIVAFTDHGRKGALLLNSWGDNWVAGPVRFGHEPIGSFWVDWKIIEKMVKAQDAYCIRGFNGYRK